MALEAELLEILRRSCSSLGTTFTPQGGSRVLAEQANRMLFAKIGQKAQVLGEAESLQAMYHASLAAGHGQGETLIPAIHAFGETSDGRRAYLVTDYKDIGGSLNATAQRALGTKLAQMHLHGKSENGMYGFARPTHCGETEQDNTWTSSWQEFWAERRIGDLVRRSGDRELAGLEQKLRERVYPLLFCEAAMKNVQPAIIHGDLWSGNSGLESSSGQPIIFDPSSSYSHNEAELGIMKMFGGYSSDFFNAYHAVIPRAQPYYSQRQELYEAYHHLNHFVIFGGGYRAGTVRIFKKLIAWAEEEWPNFQPPSPRDGDDNKFQDAPTSTADSNNRSGHGRGLRGGATGGSEGAVNLTDDLMSFQFSNFDWDKKDPPAPGAGVGAQSISNAMSEPADCDSTYRREQIMSGAHHHAGEKAQQTCTASLPLPPTPAQIADFFSQMICYIWYNDHAPRQSRPNTPNRSPNCRSRAMQCSPRLSRWPMMGFHHSATQHRSISGLAGRGTHAKTASTGCLPISPRRSSDVSKEMQDSFIASAVSSPTPTEISSSAAIDPTMLRLQPKSRFLRFTRDLLATTQVSTSVITLALIYVARLKAMHPRMKGREGSEYRLAISSLMLANKILDDNTYLNKTWAEISEMPLIEISKMETEFWLGLKMQLHISKEDYDMGLRDLQLLADSRARAIRERETMLAHASTHHHHQQFAQQRRCAHLAHTPDQYWPAAGVSNPYGNSQWSSSSDGLNASQISGKQTSWPAAGRHSLGNIEHFDLHPDVNATINLTGTRSPEYGVLGFNNLSPEAGNGNFNTFPSSPMSSGSNAPSLAMTSNEALAHSDVEANTPQDVFVPSLQPGATCRKEGVPTMPSLHSFDPMQYWMANLGSDRPASSQVDTFGGQMLIDSKVGHSTTTLGLKRDLDMANFAPMSPSDVRSAKRSAHEAQYPFMREATPYLNATSNEQDASMNLVSYPSHTLKSFQRAGGGTPQHDGPMHDAINSTLHSPSIFTAGSRSPKSHCRGLQGTPMSHNYNFTGTHPPKSSWQDLQPTRQVSAFTSALTPTSLIAPVVSSARTDEWPSSKPKAPLQYYSLAAGEPRGVLGTYVPPVSNLQSQTKSFQPSTVPYGAHNHGQSSTFAPDASISISPKSEQPSWTTSHAPFNRTVYNMNIESAPEMCSGSSITAGHAYANPIGKMNLNHSLAPPSALEVRAPSPSSVALASTFVDTTWNEQAQFPPSLQQTRIHGQPQSPTGPPPFALDVHMWPLMTSNMAGYLFPYHHMPPHGSMNRPTTG